MTESRPRADEGSAALLRAMLLIRLAEETIQRLYPEQEMRCPTHLSIGQEAVAAGVCAALRPDDFVLSAHRSHAHYLAKGGDLRSMFAELYGKVTGCARGKGGSMHLIDRSVGFLGAVPIVGSTIAIGAGVAFQSVLSGRDQVTAVFFGDAATETGVFHESLNFAVLHRLPMLFVCENNLYSVLSGLEVRQPSHRTIVDLARGHGATAHQGDGNAAAAVRDLAVDAVAQVRSRSGPVLLELATYRYFEHCGPSEDSALGYRPAGELDAWRERDPIAAYESRLRESGAIDDAAIESMRAELTLAIDDAVEFARKSPFPDADELAMDVYAS